MESMGSIEGETVVLSVKMERDFRSEVSVKDGSSRRLEGKGETSEGSTQGRGRKYSSKKRDYFRVISK